MSILIQKLRLQRGWSQQQLADLAGLSVRTVQRIESGQKATAESLKSLAAVFEVEFQELRAAMEGEEPSEQSSNAPPLSSPLANDPEPVAMSPTIPDPVAAATYAPASPRTRREARLALSDDEVRAFRHVRRLRGFYIHLMIYVAVITGLVVLNLWRTPDRLWVLGPMFGWGIGIAAHALSVFGGGRLFGPEWERRQVEKQLGRKLVLALAVTSVLGSAADVLAAGFQRVELADAQGTIEVAIWYPSDVPPQNVTMGPIEQRVAVGAPIRGERLPLVVFSHGTGGSSLSHFDTGIALADAGFVAVGLVHPGDNFRDTSRARDIDGRMRHVSVVLDHMTKTSPLAAAIDASRIGVLGMSAGGYTALRLIGGRSDLAKVPSYCREYPTHYVCGVANRGGNADAANPAVPGDPRDARIKAAVVAAPALGFTFAAQSLESIDMPVQLWRAEADTVLPEPHYVEAVRRSMPKADYRVVKGAGHYDFLAPCSAALAAAAREICDPTPGFDRAAFKGEFNREVVAFFRRAIGAAPAR